MPHMNQRRMRYPLYGIMAVSAVLLIFVAFSDWWIAAVMALILIALFYFAIRAEKEAVKATEEYITTLSYRVKKVGEEALMEMPIGIMLINDDYYIEWTNPFMASCFNENTLVGRSLYDVGEQIIPLIKQDIETENVTINEQKVPMFYQDGRKITLLF